MESHVAQAGLSKFTKEPRMTLNSWPTYLHLLIAGITGVHHQVWI